MARRHQGPGTHRELFPTPPPARKAPAASQTEAPRCPRSTAATRALWLCLQCPDVPLAALTRDRREESGQAAPLAVITFEGNSAWVEVANDAAEAAGIGPGLPLNAAYALCPQLETLNRSPHHEAALQASVARFCQRFSSQVSLEPPDAWLLEIRGSLKLFGGSRALISQLLNGLRQRGLVPRWAISPTPLASLWLARAGGGQRVAETGQLATVIGALPLSCTGWPDKLLRSLGGMGLRTLRDCLRLPRDGFARRFGRARLAELDRALGRQAEPRPLFEAPAVFARRRDLVAQVDRLDWIATALAPLLDELGEFLLLRQCAIEAFDVRLEHPDAPATELTLRLAGLAREAKRFKALVNERFEYLKLPDAVNAVAVTAGELRLVTGRDGELFARASSAAPWPQLVERLRARLGESAVQGLSLLPEHRPEHAWRYVEPGEAGATLHVPERPLWLLEPARELEQRRGYPWLGGEVQLVRGPERIETGWWSGEDVVRDYYVARCPRGTLLWLYRSRRPPKHWFLQGIFG